jgi:DNA helicase II / ATP-dependent DNA helicase PcrA
LRDLMASFARWRALVPGLPHTELAEIILDESGYTDMWEATRTPDAEGRLENLKELVRSMADYDNHGRLPRARRAGHGHRQLGSRRQGLDHDAARRQGAGVRHRVPPRLGRRPVPPPARARRERPAGLEEERRLAYVGITRAKRGATISFAQNRRVHNQWQSAIPSRFIDELPEAHVEVDSSQSYGGYGMGYGGGYGASRFDEAFTASSYQTPGWQRAQARAGTPASGATASAPHTIEGRLIAQDTDTSPFDPGEPSSTRNSATARLPASTATSSR